MISIWKSDKHTIITILYVLSWSWVR